MLLGGREMRVRLDQRHSKLLQAMAKKYGLSPTTFAEMLLADAVVAAANEGVGVQLWSAVLSLWCSGRAA